MALVLLTGAALVFALSTRDLSKNKVSVALSVLVKMRFVHI